MCVRRLSPTMQYMHPHLHNVIAQEHMDDLARSAASWRAGRRGERAAGKGRRDRRARRGMRRGLRVLRPAV
jgi:hypothetical protein